MNNSFDIVLRLLQNALWKTDVGEIRDCNWEEIEDIVKKHLIGSILASIDRNAGIPKSSRDKWIAAAAYQMVNNHRLLSDQDSMLKILSDADIPVVILKGVASSQYYPRSEFRSMGDVDFMVPREKYEDAYRALSANGFTLIHERSETERHIELKHNGFIYELHRFYTVSNDQKYAERLDNLILSNIEKRIMISFEGHCVPVLPPLINGLVLLQHINHHLERGLGLRQIIDWMMFFFSVIDSAGIWEEFHEYAVLTGLSQLEYYVTSMCIHYLGLKSPTDAYDADRNECYELLQYILTSGNFGQAQAADDTKVTMVLKRNRSLVQRVRMMYRNGNIHWKETHKHSLLPPFAFAYQLIRYIKEMNKRGISIGRIGSIARQHKKKQDMFDRMGVRVFAKGNAVYKNGKYDE